MGMASVVNNQGECVMHLISFGIYVIFLWDPSLGCLQSRRVIYAVSWGICREIVPNDREQQLPQMWYVTDVVGMGISPTIAHSHRSSRIRG